MRKRWCSFYLLGNRMVDCMQLYLIALQHTITGAGSLTEATVDAIARALAGCSRSTSRMSTYQRLHDGI